MDLSVVIVSYNTRDLLEQALRTVLDAATHLETEIFVVDNASSDDSVQMVATKFPTVRLICNEQNLGFAGGNNVALRQLQGRHVLLLNSDTIIQTETLDVLVGYLDDNPKVGAAGCKILNPDGTMQLSCRRGFPTPLAAFCKMSGLSWLFPKNRLLAQYNLTYLDPEAINEVDALSGSCMMVRKAAMDQVGMLDEDYFFYGEDLDWCFRIRQAGWKISYVPKTEIIHFQGESSRAQQMRFRYRFYEAMSIFVNKHMQQRYRFFPLWILHIGIILYGALSFGINLLKKLGLPLVDMLLVLMGLKLGLTLRYHEQFEPLIRQVERLSQKFGFDAEPTRWVEPPAYSEVQWMLVYVASIAIWLLAFYLVGLYERRKFSVLWSTIGVSLGFAIIVTTVFFFKGYNFSRLAAGTAWLWNIVLLGGWRLVAQRYLRTSSGRRLGRRRVLVIGTDTVAVDFVEYVNGVQELDFEVIGLIAQQADLRGKSVGGKPVLGVVNEMQQLVREYRIDDLVFTSGAISDFLQEAHRGWRSPKLRLCMVPESFASLVHGRQPSSMTDLPLIEISS